MQLFKVVDPCGQAGGKYHQTPVGGDSVFATVNVSGLVLSMGDLGSKVCMHMHLAGPYNSMCVYEGRWCVLAQCVRNTLRHVRTVISCCSEDKHDMHTHAQTLCLCNKHNELLLSSVVYEYTHTLCLYKEHNSLMRLCFDVLCAAVYVCRCSRPPTPARSPRGRSDRSRRYSSTPPYGVCLRSACVGSYSGSLRTMLHSVAQYRFSVCTLPAGSTLAALVRLRLILCGGHAL